MKQRVYFLDSIRGLAAVTVIATHFAESFAGEGIAKEMIQPLGRSAVVMFFLLSGIALSLSLQKYTKLTGQIYSTYVIKRFFRIYMPFFIVILLSYSLFQLIEPHGMANLSDWFNTVGTNLSSGQDLAQNLLMTGNHVDRIDPVIWSLIIEMRISLIFPILYFLIKKRGKLTVLIVAGISFVTGIGILAIMGQRFLLGQTVFHTGFFALGIGLSLYQAEYKLKIQVHKKVLFYFSVLLYFHVVILNALELPHIQVVSDTAIGAGSMGILLVCYHSRYLQQELSKKVYHGLGRYSFSLYLIHCVVFIPILYVLSTQGIGTLSSELISLPIIFITAFFIYYIIENPARLLGVYLSNRVNTTYYTPKDLQGNK